MYNLRIPFLLLGLCAIWACQDAPTAANAASGSGEQQPEKQEEVSRKNIVFFGTSLTAAYQLSPEQGFPALIQDKIDSLGLAYRCINAGLSGETSVDGKNRIDWVLQQPVDIFVLELGANDALRGLPVEEAQQNLQTILDRVKAKYPDCKLVIAGMLAPPNLGPRYTKDFAAMYPELAKANDAALIPFLLEGVAADPELNLGDGIHPNENGQKIVAQNVWKVLHQML
ncbi:MAG: arylesterase [Saprospiraceae bacterium]|nr:arylesterase [Lewinellaceae bacterium]